MSEKTREEIGRQASIEGFANEKILCGILMKKYGNVSLVDLPLSPYDIIIVRKLASGEEDIIRIQSKTANSGSVSFVSGSRGGVDRMYVSDVKTYIQTPIHSDCIVGVHSVDDKIELYFVPTLLIETLGTKSISLNKIKTLRNNFEILENCKNKDIVFRLCKEYNIITV